MKKLLFSLALLASSTLPAEDVSLGFTNTAATGNAAQSAAVIYGRQIGTGILRQVGVDADGKLQTIGSGGNVSISAGAVTAAQGAAGASAWPVSLSTTPSYTSLSVTAVQIFNEAYSVNLTTAAGVSGECQACFGGLGPSAGFYYAWNNSATPPASFGYYYAVSTTPICIRDLRAGTHLHFTGTANTATVTAQVNFMVKQ